MPPSKMLNVPLKLHARRGDMHLSISSGHSVMPLSPNSSTLSPRFPSSRSYGPLLGASSPPPSPALPSLLPRHGKKKPVSSTHRTLRRVLITFGSVLVLGWLAMQAFSGRRISRELGGATVKVQYEMVPDSAAPEEPAAIIVTDAQDRIRWTVSIPHKYKFPLMPDHYRDICKQADEMAMHVAEMGSGSKLRKKHMGYYGTDPDFMDVAEAEKQGILASGSAGTSASGIAGNEANVCAKSLTYVLETSDAGLGSSLMGMWTAYGLAKKEGRAFFVDDTRWPYGRYTSLFKPAPAAGCAPPPASQRLPCPHSAAHLVVSAATFQSAFGHQFHEEFEDPKKMGVRRQESIFALARAGYEDLFHLADEGDTHYALSRKLELMDQTRQDGGLVVGLHVRRGDKHPWEFQYSKDYLPLTRYMDEAKQIFEQGDGVNSGSSDQVDLKHSSSLASRALNAVAHTRLAQAAAPQLPEQEQLAVPSNEKHSRPDRSLASKMLLASDDPDVYDTPEVAGTLRAQDRIMLASKTALEKASAGNQPANKYIDEIHGWEGGFFRDQFWGLGQDSSSAANTALPDTPPSDAALGLRAMVGRAYLLDLAVLAQADYVVCGVSSMGCRLLAVMMGWDKAIVHKGWRNVDGASSFEWTSIIW